MEKIRVAVVGYGNIGKYAVSAVLAAKDMVLAGVVRREPDDDIGDIKVVTDIKELGTVDVALLCSPTRTIEEEAVKYLKMGINTVDSYDIHSTIYELKLMLEKVAKETGAVAVISAGWDPGSDSVVRALLEACAPKGITYTNFGPGMSMGHTVAVKAKEGVKNALSMTIPVGTSIHRRIVYVELNDGVNFSDVEKAIKQDPYFSSDETHVIQVSDVNEYIDKGHGVNMVRKGVSGQTDNQLFEFNMKINNPALTAQIMVSSARASKRQAPGAYTMIEIPMVDFLDMDKETAIRRLV
ncbi:MAG: diaminopimelate dehydrogenase [Defluviitaleaceae bacterium]|nr:diaminopimelate dehydrogenase [Defluviitaleaceae bacterium]